jgi:hypothetical protein
VQHVQCLTGHTGDVTAVPRPATPLSLSSPSWLFGC